MKKINYGKTLIYLRKTQNVPQKTVAEALAVSRPTYVSWEADCGDLPFSKIVLLSKFYDISVHIIIQMLYDDNRLSNEQDDFDIAVLKSDINSIKEVLKKYS